MKEDQILAAAALEIDDGPAFDLNGRPENARLEPLSARDEAVRELRAQIPRRHGARAERRQQQRKPPTSDH